MKVAILARGGSIWRTWARTNRDQYSAVIGINTACNVFACDYIAACDGHTYDAIRYYPRSGFIYRSDLPGDWENIAARRPWSRMAGHDMSPKRHQYPIGITPEFSIESAIVFAYDLLHADTVDLYGVDLGGDCRDGEIPGVKANDNEERWNKEARALEKITSHYQCRRIL